MSLEPIPSDSVTNNAAANETAPLDTSKCELLNDATPLLDVLASSPAIVIWLSDTVVSIPSPPVKVKVSPVENESFDPLSAASDKLDTTVPKLNWPEPSVLRNWPFEPSPSGNVNVVFEVTAFGALSPTKLEPLSESSNSCRLPPVELPFPTLKFAGVGVEPSKISV